MKYQNIREEELKNKVAQDYFWLYDNSKIIGNVDFCVAMHQSINPLLEGLEVESLLWAEAKKGSSDIYKSLVQLILTIGKARTFDKYLPPAMLGALDGEKIAFIPYNDIQDIFYTNDFNWNVTPSNHNTKEFKLIYEKVKTIIDAKTLLFNFLNDDKDLQKFIKNNFKVGNFGITKTKIDKNNFIAIYNKWLQYVKPTISLNWDLLKNKYGIIDGDFYLADILSKENKTLKEKLYVLLATDHYVLDRQIDESGFFSSKRSDFNDNQVAHTQFWNKYERPPKEEYWDYIVERRDLLVPQDVRERKGSFFTPQIWVELSQKYLTDVLGEDWQDEYYIWDCAAGTGNLLAGLTNKYNIWASTLDKQDVDVMHDRINNGANLLQDHVFQFDFLNDDFTKLPKPLQDIINNPEKRKKLVMYINPPYAEATATDTINNKTLRHKSGVSQNKTYEKYSKILGRGINEVFIQFLIKIYKEIPNCKIAEFSTIKILLGQNLSSFRSVFTPKLEKLFLIPGNTFDNVKGKFPIGFFIWNTEKNVKFDEVQADVYIEKNKNIDFIGNKNIKVVESKRVILNWMQQFYDKNEDRIAYVVRGASDFQNNQIIFITLNPSKAVVNHSQTHDITKNNLIQNCIYFAVRKSIEANWLNNQDQFLFPNNKWEKDEEFHNDCLTFTLFHGKNQVSSNNNTNHWIPFTEQEVNAREKFESNFMTQFLKGKIPPSEEVSDIFTVSEPKPHYEVPLLFSPEAQEVFNAGRELWKYYHKSPLTPKGGTFNVNASLYDIREYFQGRNEKGKMNNKSTDENYSALIAILRDKLKHLAEKIEPKVYEYEFLKK
jgi:hypothetical protein